MQRNNNFNNNNSNRNYRRFRDNRNNRNNRKQNNRVRGRRKPTLLERQMINDNPVSNKRGRVIKRRFFRNRLGNNNSNKRMEKQIDEVINKLDTMTIKSTNLHTTKKEVRTDKLISPYSMARRSQYIPIYEIKEKVLHTSVYTKITLNFDGAGDSIRYSVLFFPYSINFKSNLYNYYNNPVMVSGGRANHFKNIFFLADNQTAQNFTVQFLGTAGAGIIGNWKLIGTTIKIYNTSSMLNKGGDFTIIKIQSNEIHPEFVHSGSEPPISVSTSTRDFINRDYYQAPRNNFSASDTVFIDEYNVSNGSNIFNTPEEYMGTRYQSKPETTTAAYTSDYVGSNVVYLFQSLNVSTPQTYVFEVWNVFSVIPSPDSGLGNLGTVSKRCFNSEVVNSIKDRPNMYKANK